jgi:hypothetical protein
MDPAKVILRQLDYCRRAASTPAERQLVEWWRSKVEELRDLQPVQPPAPAAIASARTGTEG